MYLFSHSAYLEASQKTNIENAQEYAISYAKECAAQLIEIDKYDMILETDSPTTSMGDTSFYYVMFLKKVNGFNSMEYISFKMSSKGVLATYTAGERPGTFDGCQNADCTAEMVDASVNYEMSKKGAPFSYYCDEVEFKNQKFVLTPSGEYGVYSKITVQWEHSKTEAIDQSGVMVFTKFGERTLTSAPAE